LARMFVYSVVTDTREDVFGCPVFGIEIHSPILKRPGSITSKERVGVI